MRAHSLQSCAPRVADTRGHGDDALVPTRQRLESTLVPTLPRPGLHAARVQRRFKTHRRAHLHHGCPARLPQRAPRGPQLAGRQMPDARPTSTPGRRACQAIEQTIYGLRRTASAFVPGRHGSAFYLYSKRASKALRGKSLPASSWLIYCATIIACLAGQGGVSMGSASGCSSLHPPSSYRYDTLALASADKGR